MLNAFQGAPAYLLALAMTLVLASFLTPRAWWRRPTARGLAIVGGGTCAIGALLLYAVAAPPLSPSFGTVAHAGTAPADTPTDAPMQHIAVNVPEAGRRYRVHRDLNVRSAAGVGAALQDVIRSGTIVMPTGARAGDWWQIRYDGGAGAQVGWTSSLWLRRAGEHALER